MTTTAAIDAAEITRQAVALTGAGDDYDHILELVGNRRFVLLGEASHGTHEFYRERARITQRLIEEKGFTAVAVEADWPDAYRINRYVLGQSADEDAKAALADFRRFPAWMWRNTDVVRFVEWLRARNDVEAGLFQGLKPLRLRNRSPFPVDPATVDAAAGTFRSRRAPHRCQAGHSGVSTRSRRQSL